MSTDYEDCICIRCGNAVRAAMDIHTGTHWPDCEVCGFREVRNPVLRGMDLGVDPDVAEEMYVTHGPHTSGGFGVCCIQAGWRCQIIYFEAPPSLPNLLEYVSLIHRQPGVDLARSYITVWNEATKRPEVAYGRLRSRRSSNDDKQLSQHPISLTWNKRPIPLRGAVSVGQEAVQETRSMVIAALGAL